MHNDLPSTEEIKDIWTFDPDTIDVSNADAQSRKKTQLLLWYADVYLGLMVGPGTWGLNHRKYKMLVDVTPIKYLPSSSSKTCVTVSHEAFAQLVYENCRDKWVNTFKLKREKGEKALIPTRKDDPDYAKYQAKWSDRRSGHVKGSGWDPASRTVFIQLMNDILTNRETDQKNNWKKHEFVKSLVQGKYNITSGTPPTTTARKRKRPQSVTPPPPLLQVIEDMPTPSQND